METYRLFDRPPWLTKRRGAAHLSQTWPQGPRHAPLPGMHQSCSCACLRSMAHLTMTGLKVMYAEAGCTSKSLPRRTSRK